jgi:hypothetical protein
MKRFTALRDASTSRTSATNCLVNYFCTQLYDKQARVSSGASYGRYGYPAAIETSSPAFLREKALFELSAYDENSEDPWNAARWLEQLRAMPGMDDYVKPWLSYKIAELHLKQGYKPEEARQALKAIVESGPGTPLGIQAKELLKSED